MSVAFLFPGQGAQNEGLLHYLPQHPEVTRTISEARTLLGQDIGALDNAEALHSTIAVQTALLIAGVATARALMAERVLPAAVAGMSIGAFGAAIACGTLSFADALPLVQLRGELMHAAFPSGYGLAFIEGLDEIRVGNLVEQIRTAQSPVYISNINAPRQVVRAERLAVTVPSHCPLLQSVADRMEKAMSTLPLRPSAVPYMSNRGGRALYDGDAIREDLATSVAHPVRWFDALEVLRELGTNLFIEMAPGHVSTNLVAESIPGVRAISIADRGLRYASVVAAGENRGSELAARLKMSPSGHSPAA
jgi:malonate decarboxylase epsilon subunit